VEAQRPVQARIAADRSKERSTSITIASPRPSTRGTVATVPRARYLYTSSPNFISLLVNLLCRRGCRSDKSFSRELQRGQIILSRDVFMI